MLNGCGPFATILGPPPEAPPYSLLTAARVVPDVDGDGIGRWESGVKVYPYPLGGETIAAAAAGSLKVKGEGDIVPLPEFGALVVYVAETCSSKGIWGGGLSQEEAQSRFAGRAQAVLGAVTSSLIAAEFMAGLKMGTQPHLADGNGTFPNGDTPTNVVNGLVLLENEIGKGGKGGGMIHMTPGLALASDRLIHEDVRAGKLRTINGTIIVPDAGYVIDDLEPLQGHDPAADGTEWVFATGPVEIRRSEVFLTPNRVAEALDRPANSITYRAEQVYVVDWDTTVQAAVLIDRCLADCG